MIRSPMATHSMPLDAKPMMADSGRKETYGGFR